MRGFEGRWALTRPQSSQRYPENTTPQSRRCRAKARSSSHRVVISPSLGIPLSMAAIPTAESPGLNSSVFSRLGPHPGRQFIFPEEITVIISSIPTFCAFFQRGAWPENDGWWHRQLLPIAPRRRTFATYQRAVHRKGPSPYPEGKSGAADKLFTDRLRPAAEAAYGAVPHHA
jgi:hypothetical protein